MHIAVRRKLYLIIQDRLQHRHFRFRFDSQPFSRPGMGKSCNRTDGPRRSLLCKLKFCAGVDADLVCFFLISKNFLYFQSTSGDLHISQAVSLIIPGNFVDLCSKLRGIIPYTGI